MSVVRLSRLSKRYGSHPALVDVDLEIDQGEVFGYLGPNGAGKTTTIRILLGLLRPTTGRAEVFGLDTWSDAVAVHARTGYVPGEPGLWERLTGAATITYLARLRDDLAQVARARVLAERLDLDLGRRVGALSKGNKQKLVIVQAFMGDPELIVLDEPTTGLDPLMQQEFHAIVRETTARGGTVLLSVGGEGLQDRQPARITQSPGTTSRPHHDQPEPAWSSSPSTRKYRHALI